MTLPLLITAALLADGLTANVSRELNPIGAAILSSGFGFAAKAAEAAGVLAVIAIIRDSRPRLAGLVAVVAVCAGTLGAWSNIGTP